MANTGTVVVRILGDSKGLNAALAESDAKVGGFGESLSGLSGAAVATGAVIAGSFVAAGVGLFALGDQFHSAFSTIRVATGATGTALDSLDQSFKNVLAVRPDSMDAVATTIGKLNSKLGDTGPQLEAVAVSELRLAAITKSDLGETLDSTSTAFQNFGVSAADQPAKLDELFRASQATGVSITDLATQMGDTGIQLQALGFNFDQSATLVAGLGKAGISVSDVLPALNKVLAVGAKEGKSASDTYTGLVDSIKNAPNDIEASKIAFDALGARAGPKLAAAIREGKFSFDDLGNTIVNGTDTIAKAATDTSTISGKLGIFRNQIEVAFEPLATTLFDAINNAAAVVLPALGDALAIVATDINDFVVGFTKGTDDFGSSQSKFAQWGAVVYEKVNQVVEFFKTKVLPILQQVAAWVGDHLTPILFVLGGVLGSLVVASIVASLVAFATAIASPIVAIGLLVGALIYAYNNVEGFRTVVDAVASFLVNVVAPAIGSFVAFMSEQIAHLADWWRDHWAAIQEAVGHVTVVISDIINAFITVVQAAWQAFGDTILTFVRDVWNEIAAVVTFFVTQVRDVIDFVLALINGDWGDAWRAIVDMFTSTWDLLKATVVNALDFIVTFTGDQLETIVRYFGDLPGRVWSVLQALPGILGGVASAAFSAFLNVQIAILDQIVGWVAGLPMRIIGAIGDLGSLLYQKGVDLINGLKNGILDAAKSIAGDIAGAALGPVGGAIAGALGFAGGTPDLPQGFSRINEQGPEAIVRRGDEVAVFPAMSRESLHGVGGSGGVNFNGPVTFAGGDAAEVIDELEWSVRVGSLKGAA